MQTRCPQCDTIFRISEEQLALADGQVRCGECDTVFDARASLVETIADDRAAEMGSMQLEAVSLDPVDIDRDAMQFDIPGLDIPSRQAATDHDQAPAFDSADAAEVTPDAVADDAAEAGDGTGTDTGDGTDAGAEPLHSDAPVAPTGTDKPQTGYDAQTLFPEFKIVAPIEVPPRPLATVTGILAILVLLLLLLGQYAYFERDRLARHAALRPLLGSLCQVLDCRLAALREPERVRLLRHEVHSHPTRPDALYINATIVNDAGANQAYPLLRVMFRDSDGRLLAQRDFLPGEYLPADVDPARGMTPGEPVNIQLELVDPGKQAVSYEFDFL